MDSKKRLSVRSILNTASYLIVFLAGMSFMLNSVMLVPTPMGIVTSKSMVPTVGLGDIVFLQPAAIEEIKIGDIIAFHAPPDETTVIHRVVRVLRFPEKIYLITKGDANPVTDQEVGGWLGVDSRRLMGKVYCLDGLPVRIPFIGLYVIAARNFSIWLTQNKIWSFWAPLLAMLYIFGPYLLPRGAGKPDFRKSLRVRIPVKAVFTYSLLAFVAISTFTLYFRTEVYSLGMRVACLEDFPESRYISFGSMIYEETKNNTITVNGAPLFPVKTFVCVTGNASRLVTPIPSSARIEPDSLNDLILQASIPPRGTVDPGLYGGMVYIFSDTLLLFLPDTVIFPVLSLIPNPWIAVFLLDVLIALVLTSLLASIALAINWVSMQILYTLVWRDKLETRPPPALKVKIHHFAKRVGAMFQKIAARVGGLFSVVRKDVELGRVLKIVCVAIVPATILFLLADNVLLPVVTLGLTLGVLMRKRRRGGEGEGELVFSAALANLLVSAVFIVRKAAVFLYSTVNPYWCMVSASFVGNISNVITLPLAISITLLSFVGLQWVRVWYLEQQTSNWQFVRPGEAVIEKTITIPSLEEFEGRKRRRLTISEIKGVIGSFAALRAKAKGALAKLSRKLVSSLKTLRLEVHVSALYLKGKENDFVRRGEPFLRLLENFKSKLRFGKKRIKILMKNVRCTFSWLGYKLIHSVKRRGEW